MNKHVEMLKLYNQWRRGKIDHLGYTAHEIGQAIDAVIYQHADLITTVEILRARLGARYDDIDGVCIAEDAVDRCNGEQE